MSAIDLEELPALDRDLRLFSLDRANLFSLRARDYTTSFSHEHISTTLVTNLRFAGYTFNPVSFFLRYANDDLIGVTAEVNNTYGGRHCYELDHTNRVPRSDAAPRTASDAAPRTASDAAPRTASDAAPRTASDSRIGFRTTREFFVSPFLHGPRVYEWWFPAKRDPARLAITMHVDTQGGERIFTATFAGERRSMSDRALLGAALRYPVNTAQVIGLIHLEALKLRYVHREPYRRPGPDHRPLDE